MKTNMHAFPQHPEQNDVATFGGMSIRDYFAAAALQGMIANPELGGTTDNFAVSAYIYADAMIAERIK